MIKIDELSKPSSCMMKARPEEMVFTLLARDPAAPEAIRQWCKKRIKMGLNKKGDSQIAEAMNAAGFMNIQRKTLFGKE